MLCLGLPFSLSLTKLPFGYVCWCSERPWQWWMNEWMIISTKASLMINPKRQRLMRVATTALYKYTKMHTAFNRRRCHQHEIIQLNIHTRCCRAHLSFTHLVRQSRPCRSLIITIATISLNKSVSMRTPCDLFFLFAITGDATDSVYCFWVVCLLFFVFALIAEQQRHFSHSIFYAHLSFKLFNSTFWYAVMILRLFGGCFSVALVFFCILFRAIWWCVPDARTPNCIIPNPHTHWLMHTHSHTHSTALTWDILHFYFLFASSIKCIHFEWNNTQQWTTLGRIHEYCVPIYRGSVLCTIATPHTISIEKEEVVKKRVYSM